MPKPQIKRKPDNTPSLEDLYQKYLDMVGLQEQQMIPIQRTETKRAFYGACFHLFNAIYDITSLPENQIAGNMDAWWSEAKNFWREQAAGLRPN